MNVLARRNIEPLEREIQSAVIAHWGCFGLPNTLVAAIPNANAFGQPGLTRGLFDLVVFGPEIHCGFIELKAARGKLSAAQEEHRMLLIRLAVPNAVCFGRDEPIRLLEQWKIVRRHAA